MKTIVRVGGLVGAVAFVLLYAAQTSIGLAVAPGIVCAGFCAGVGSAKWLEREWYGRQLRAGFRAGAIASGIAGLGALLSLLVLGPRDTTMLAARSHVAGLNFAPATRTFSFLGWAGTDVVAVLIAVLLGAGIAALVCQVFAWSKSARAVRIITQARLAAQALNRDASYRPTGAPATYGQAAHVSNLLAPLGSSMPGVVPTAGTTPAFGIIPPPTFSPSSVPAPASQRRPTAAPATPFAKVPYHAGAPAPAAQASEHAPTEPAIPITPGPDSTGRPSPSGARRVEEQLTEAMREALAAWADDAGADAKKARDAGNKGKPARAPAPSAYLNSSPPPKRVRKKQDTQDWLC